MERAYLRDMMPVTQKRRARKPRRRGRKPKGKVAMTAAQRQAKRRAKLRKAAPGQAIIRAWDTATPQGRRHFLKVIGLRPLGPLQRSRIARDVWQRHPPGQEPIIIWPNGRPPYDPKDDPLRATNAQLDVTAGLAIHC